MHICAHAQGWQYGIPKVCWGIHFYFLCLGLGKIVVQVSFNEKENVSFNLLFLCGSFYISPDGNISSSCAMGRLVTFLVLRFQTHWSEDLSIFQPFTDGTAKCHFRDFSAIMLKSLVICIVNCIYLKPSFLYSTPQNIFQGLIISLLWLALPHSLDDSVSFWSEHLWYVKQRITEEMLF